MSTKTASKKRKLLKAGAVFWIIFLVWLIGGISYSVISSVMSQESAQQQPESP